MKYLLIITTFLLFISCINQYKGNQLSTVTVNSKRANHLIVDRFPDYGDGHKDGCIVMDQMRLNLRFNKLGVITGQVSDVSTKEPLQNALVILNDNLGLTDKLVTDSLGQFSTSTQGKIIGLQIDYIGYRRLVVKF